jgi:hypothetical protein
MAVGASLLSCARHPEAYAPPPPVAYAPPPPEAYAPPPPPVAYAPPPPDAYAPPPYAPRPPMAYAPRPPAAYAPPPSAPYGRSTYAGSEPPPPPQPAGHLVWRASKQWAVIKTEPRSSAVEQASQAKFKAAQAKAAKVGVEHLTNEDIDGLNATQLKELRGY